jgi:hypothetical protein
MEQREGIARYNADMGERWWWERPWWTRTRLEQCGKTCLAAGLVAATFAIELGPEHHEPHNHADARYVVLVDTTSPVVTGAPLPTTTRPPDRRDHQ